MKNKEPHQIPVCDYIYQLLKRRDDAKKDGAVYVFPSELSSSGCIVENKRAVKKIIKDSGVKFMTHDLRRTFLTIGEHLGIERPTLKRLASHTTGSDVTERYIQAETERLREPAQRIADYILEAAKIRPARRNAARQTTRRTAGGGALVAL